MLILAPEELVALVPSVFPRYETDKALAILGLDNDLPRYRELRKKGTGYLGAFEIQRPVIRLSPGAPRVYGTDAPTDNRSAWGKALEDRKGVFYFRYRIR